MTARAGAYVPQISQDELFAFHESHFSPAAITSFCAKFPSLLEAAAAFRRGAVWSAEASSQRGLKPDVQASAHSYPDDGDDDDDDYDPEASYPPLVLGADVAVGFADGEMHADDSKPKKKKRRKKKKSSSNGGGGGGGGSSHSAGTHKRNDEKPDLRKRTWDVVDTTGLGSLDYDGVAQDLRSMPAPPQRRRVQYDDDDD